MYFYVFATFCIFSVSGYSVLDEDYIVLESDTDDLQWATTYTVKATRFSLTSNIVEDYTAWKTNMSSRVDFNEGAVKVITVLPETSNGTAYKYEIHPETTEEELNKIVCRLAFGALMNVDISLDEILPVVTEDELFEPVGNETIDEVETVKFEFNELTNGKEVRKTVWAYYSEDIGWVPVRYEMIKFNTVLGSLTKHEIWQFFDYEPDFDEDVFDFYQFGCDENAVKHTSDSEKITKELLFVDPENEKHFNYIFNHFKNKFERKYAHEYEHALRETIFRENMRRVSSVNRRNLTYKLGINQFSDWTPEEIQTSLGTLPRPPGKVGTIAFPYEENELNDIIDELPKQYDMRTFGLVSPVKNQETCGSCWTFATAAVTEGALARVNGGRVLALSNQALVDCAYDELGKMHGGGCRGGTDSAAYDFIMKHGLPTEQEYGPYKNRDGYCKIRNMTKTYPITGYTDVTKNSANAMKVALVNHGPLFIGLHVSDEFQAYSSGIFYQSKKECDPEQLHHAVALIGYGERDGDQFWILKNSWGESWGIDGYMLAAAKENVCGIATRPSYVVI